MNRKLVPLVVACAWVAAASTAGAARAGQVCRQYKLGGKTYDLETVGTGWTCASAKSWAVKLSADHVGTVTTKVTLKNGPRGYHCFATPGSSGGHATAGTCFSGTLAFPKSGFAWLPA